MRPIKYVEQSIDEAAIDEERNEESGMDRISTLKVELLINLHDVVEDGQHSQSSEGRFESRQKLICYQHFDDEENDSICVDTVVEPVWDELIANFGINL